MISYGNVRFNIFGSRQKGEATIFDMCQLPWARVVNHRYAFGVCLFNRRLPSSELTLATKGTAKPVAYR